eukprot:scaffold191851_cov63-Attheya_sp.AAC.2
MSNASPTRLCCNYKSLLKEHMNFVDSKLNESSIMSPPVFTINTANQSTESLLLHSQVLQEGQVVSNSGRGESTDGRNNSNIHGFAETGTGLRSRLTASTYRSQ